MSRRVTIALCDHRGARSGMFTCGWECAFATCVSGVAHPPPERRTSHRTSALPTQYDGCPCIAGAREQGWAQRRAAGGRSAAGEPRLFFEIGGPRHAYLVITWSLPGHYLVIMEPPPPPARHMLSGGAPGFLWL